MPKLSAPEVRSSMERLPGWSREPDGLVRKYQFSSNVTAGTFVKRVKAGARKQHHGLQLKVKGSQVSAIVPTFERNGVTESDLDLARHIEAVFIGSPELVR